MRPIGTVLVDESHRQAWTTRPELAAVMNPVNPADASYAQARAELERAGFTVRVHTEGPLDAAALGGVDALVLPHAADDAWEHTTGSGSPRLTADELAAVEAFVRAGGGLVVLGETEQAKYGNSAAELAARFGVVIDNATVQDPAHAFTDVPTWVLADLVHGTRHDLTAEVDAACFYRAGTLHPSDTADAAAVETVARTYPTADPAGAALVLAADLPRGRVVEIYGPESSGKTTLTLQVIAEMQKLGGTCAFVDAEHALDVQYAQKLGVQLSDLLISQPDSGEQALDITGRRARVVYFGLPADDAVVRVPALKSIFWDKTIRFSWLAPLTWPTALQAISTGLVNVDLLRTHDVPLSELRDTIAAVRERKGNPIKAVVHP